MGCIHQGHSVYILPVLCIEATHLKAAEQHLVSPVISLPTSHQSQRSEGSFSLSSVEDFPPMETSVNSSVRSGGSELVAWT